MKRNVYANTLLTIGAFALVAIAIRPLIIPDTARAQSDSPRSFYVEPDVHMLRAPDGTSQVYGKVVVDLRNGKIWGFPTLSPDPYPSNPQGGKPPVSHPIFLGRFALEDTEK